MAKIKPKKRIIKDMNHRHHENNNKIHHDKSIIDRRFARDFINNDYPKLILNENYRYFFSVQKK